MTSSDPMHPPAAGRRRFLVAAGAALLAACTNTESGDGGANTAPATGADTTTATTEVGDDTPAASEAPAEEGAGDTTVPPLTEADFASLPTCLLLPEAAAGPFPLDEQLDRSDITEGYPGHPLRLGFRVVDDGCEPMAGAAVEVWHADATGDYSAFEDGGNGKDEGPGTTFCRGTQAAGADGIVEFQTIYPGWYPGRAVHIHLRVHVDGEIVLTTQLYFDDDRTAAIHRDGAYADNGVPELTTAEDGLAGDPAAEGTLLTTGDATTAAGPGTLALANLGIAI